MRARAIAYSSPWTEERIAKLRQLWASGMSASRIASALGVTRCAVLGKVHRLGLTERSTSPKKVSKSKKRRSRVGPKPLKFGRPRSPIAELFREPLPKEDTKPETTVSFDDLEPHHCRWPYGDTRNGGVTYCGCKRFAGTSYCEAHVRRVYRPPEARRLVGITPEREKELA